MPRRQRPNREQLPRRRGTMFDAPSRRAQAARELWNAGHESEALELFAEAIRKEPDNVRVYVTAARAYAEKFYFDRMEATFEKLTRRAPRDPGVHHFIGETYDMLKLPRRATASFQRAAGLPGAGPPTWMELASLYERAHQLEEAEELIERTVNSGFDLPQVPLIQGRIQRRQNRLEQADATFHRLIERMPDSQWACQAWGEIALMNDQQGDFDGAVAAIGNCKRLQKDHEEPYWAASERMHARLQQLVEDVTCDDFQRWRARIPEMAPRRVSLLSGFPRSGTTLLEQVLDAHPSIISSEERDFLGRESMYTSTARGGTVGLLETLNALGVDEIEDRRRRYVAAMEYLLDEPIGDRMHIDKNPAYNLIIPIALRVLPEMRLIIAIRDPRDVVLSCYLRYLPLNAASVHFLDIERAAARYALDMTTWLKLRQIIGGPWVEIRYEDSIADVEAQARRALETLGVEWDNQVLNYRDRLTGDKQVNSPTYEAVAKPIYTQAIGRWKNYQRLLEPVMKTLEPFIQEFGYG